MGAAAGGDNAVASRRRRIVSSRYLLYSSNNSNSVKPSIEAALPTTSVRRSYSVGRARPEEVASNCIREAPTITRSISVSFQGGSFFYQTKKPPAEPRRSTTPVRTVKPVSVSEVSRPERWPAARLSTINNRYDDGLLRQSDGGDLSPCSDTDTASSSGSNSGVVEHNVSIPPRPRCWQEDSKQIPKMQEPLTMLQSPERNVVKNLWESPVVSPTSVCSPVKRSPQSYSPSKLMDVRARGVSPLRGRNCVSLVDQIGNAPSIISFAAEVRRARKGESRIEEAHMLRLLDSRYMQWRFVNARAFEALIMQRRMVEKNLYTAWVTISGLRESVINKRIKLQALIQNLKLTTLLEKQMRYLEDWSLLESDHSTSLSKSNEALKASILRLPVLDGARVDLRELKDTMNSAVDVMKTTGSSICSLLSKVERTSSLMSEITKVAVQEKALLEQARELLSKVSAMHVMQCSLQGQILQLQ